MNAAAWPVYFAWENNVEFHYRVRGILVVGDNVLLARRIGAHNTYLPGGHIERGEAAESALVREIYEEIGKKATVKKFIGAVEHVFPAARLDNHEINLVFEIEIPGFDSAKPPQSLEDHIEFIWSELSDLKRNNLQPYPLIECLISWNADWKSYWGTTL